MHTHNKNLQVEVEVQVEDSWKFCGRFVEDLWKFCGRFVEVEVESPYTHFKFWNLNHPCTHSKTFF